MKLTVVIVNYNVAYFLEQCLNSTFKALESIAGEVYVVDNNSIDGSVKMVEEKFPQVHLIANKENTGFSVANNQAMKLAKGEYVLLLNPDTLVEEDTFKQVIAFMDAHPEAGGLGCKMVDGKGVFLPESKRGLPTPTVAFYKIFGLSKLFPNSKKFGKYHLSYLDKEEVHEIEVLSGAFMLMRKKVLDKIGLLDEAFFMYGEDIDLSYRIILGGYKNYYYPHTRIIHYKGESTKKSSVNYVFVFYNAMVIFAKKHFSQKNAKTFSILINLAIYFRASMALAARFIKKIALPIFDYGIILIGLFIIANYYQNAQGIEIPKSILKVGLSSYGLIWLLTQVFAGGYDKPSKILKNVLGGLVGTGIILMIYALLSKDYQFSRLIILFGGVFVILYYFLSRLLFSYLLPNSFGIGSKKDKKIVIVGDALEVERVKNIVVNANANIEQVFFVSHANENIPEQFSGSYNQLDQVIDIHGVNEIIFCAKNVSAEQTITQMMALDDKEIEFKISQPSSSFIIGSNSIDTQGDLYVMDINQINKASNRRNKRMLDLFIGGLLLLTMPFTVWFYKNKRQFMSNALKIFTGGLSLVGYAKINHSTNLKLPKIKHGVLNSTDLFSKEKLDNNAISRLNLIYAKNHSMGMDLKILFKNLKSLDR
ncbi:glycosyl transferase family 2 [Putridiphycobacter roseus]|uniref:Glycosyl transferase family 2 n=1 Tax=Putridiphycobacter roseus TaxID=2219161 RepID=A0A2W1MZG2_9FLAO|nr:glycosyltransferase [Putridiphycobacter roseus]PZE16774.1 glycosyl transferase family 2 [Putridiphycobacter roseus]